MFLVLRWNMKDYIEDADAVSILPTVKSINVL